ncbi:hypothetical protein HYX18_02860 [Candidatus Woesearchaeota archaeon]|nr:hypothetical protein [Candidatus Woesearchaeota archaeon]
MLEKLVKSLGLRKKILPLFTTAAISLLPIQSRAEQPRNYLFINGGYTILGPQFSDFYNSGGSYSFGVGNKHDTYGVELGLNSLSTNSDLKKTASRGLFTASRSLDVQNLNLTGIFTNLYFRLSEDFSFGLGGVVQNARVSKLFERARRGLFTASDTLSTEYDNKTLIGGRLFTDLTLLKDRNFDISVSIGAERTQGIEDKSLESSAVFAYGKLNWYLVPKKK